MNRPAPTRDNFRGVRIAGQIYARNGKPNADPIRIKTYTGPANAAEFIASLDARDLTPELVMQGEKGNVYIPALVVADRKVVLSEYAVRLVIALATPEQARLAQVIGPFLVQGDDRAGDLRHTTCHGCGEQDRLHRVTRAQVEEHEAKAKGLNMTPPAVAFLLCDDCFEQLLSELPQCHRYCNLALDHVGLCSE